MTAISAATQLNYNFAKTHGVIAETSDGALVVFHLGVVVPTLLAELQRHLQQPFKLQPIGNEEFNQKLTQLYESSAQTAVQMMAGMEEELDLTELMNTLPTTQDLLDSQDDAPIIRLLNALFAEAIKQQASDIHIESYTARVLIRFRIDGVLRQALDVSRAMGPLIISRIKVMAKLDIAEKRLPQDGHIMLTIAGNNVDVRVSTLPSSHAERVVLRILDKSISQLQLDLLGMEANDLAKIQALVHRPHGILLVTGPTGSGKTTSLYAMLTELNEVSRNILTVEDPIEYDLPGIGQTQVNSKVEMTFAKGLRAILRQDPDIIMIGEIRDIETAEIAVQASLTGHLVLSTLHTNTAIGAITRLRDMGVQPFLLASSLIGVIAQRLVRRLCHQCKQAHQADPSELKIMHREPTEQLTIYQSIGCETCQQQGYQGRIGLYEIITLDDELRTLMHEDINEISLEKIVRQSTPSILAAGFEKVLAGETSLEEILRVTAKE